MSTAILRSRILDMAIHGQLVPQDPNEGTAMDLLKEIAHQRGKAITPITDNVPFEIPTNWRWVKLGDIAINRDSERIPISSTIRNKQSNRIYDYYGATGPVDKVNDYLFDERLLLIGEDGANLLSRSKNNAFFAEGKYWVNNHAHILDCEEKTILDYIAFYINSISLEEYVTGSAQPKLSQGKMNIIPLPLPPLSEQRRIVAKVEELLGEVDKIEQAQTDITHTATILRSRILDMAIKGELTHSNTQEWENVSLIDACKITMGQSPSGESYNPIEGIEFHQGKTFFGEKYLKPSHIYTNSPTKLADAHSIVISVRAPVGTSNIVDRQICIGRGLAAICPKSNADLMFIYYLLESRSCLLYLNDNATGTTFKAISGDILKKYSFPLPPLSEQHRIVAKVEELFAEIDKLVK